MFELIDLVGYKCWHIFVGSLAVVGNENGVRSPQAPLIPTVSPGLHRTSGTKGAEFKSSKSTF